jgi:hypothetical protein
VSAGLGEKALAPLQPKGSGVPRRLGSQTDETGKPMSAGGASALQRPPLADSLL